MKLFRKESARQAPPPSLPEKTSSSPREWTAGAEDPYSPPPTLSRSKPNPPHHLSSNDKKRTQIYDTTRRPPPRETPDMQFLRRAKTLMAREDALNKLCGVHPSPPPSPHRSSAAVTAAAADKYLISPTRKHHPTSKMQPPLIAPPSQCSQVPPLRLVRGYSSADDLKRQHRSPPATKSSRRYHHDNDDDDEDDNIPLAYVTSPRSASKNSPSLLAEDREYVADEDLVPIASLSSNAMPSKLLSAADKYKETVKEKLDMESSNSDSDDDSPVSLAQTMQSLVVSNNRVRRK